MKFRPEPAQPALLVMLACAAIGTVVLVLVIGWLL
jgi:hypothetical protein